MSTEINIQTIPRVNKVLIYTNQNPNVGIDATITDVDISKYTHLIVVSNHNAGGTEQESIIYVSSDYQVVGVPNGSTGYNPTNRSYYKTANGNLAFTSGVQRQDFSRTYAVPIRIYGLEIPNF